MKGHKNTGKKENNGLKSKKGNIILFEKKGGDWVGGFEAVHDSY